MVYNIPVGGIGMQRCETYISEESLQELIERLSRIEGQINGIKRMLREKRSCDEILIQLSAVKSAVSSVAIFLLEEHFNSCVKPSINPDGLQTIEEFMKAVKHIIKGGY